VLLARTPHVLNEDELGLVAGRAHGYVGADLGAVVREAGTAVIQRWTASLAPGDPPKLNVDDLLDALPRVRPSALRAFLAAGAHETRVTFADVGGLAPVVHALREAVEWPLLHPGAPWSALACSGRLAYRQ
jgi:AAA family ATPase